MRVYDSLVRIARWLPEPVVRVLVFSLIIGVFIFSVLIIFIVIPCERSVRLRWRKLSRR